MRAVVALRRGVGVRVDVERVVRAALHARLAADAAVAVEIDDAVVARVERPRRADRHARRVLAVVAPQHREVPARAGPRARARRTSPTCETRRPGPGSPPCRPRCRRGSRCISAGRSRIRSARGPAFRASVGDVARERERSPSVTPVSRDLGRRIFSVHRPTPYSREETAKWSAPAPSSAAHFSLPAWPVERPDSTSRGHRAG